MYNYVIIKSECGFYSCVTLREWNEYYNYYNDFGYEVVVYEQYNHRLDDIERAMVVHKYHI